MHSSPRLALLLAFSLSSALVATSSATDDASSFLDRVSTIVVDQELDARGNLGGMTIDRLGFLYMANFRDKVWRISPDGEVELLTDALYGASGNAVDSRGDLYQANFLGNSISRITRDGELTTFASEGLQGPVGLVFDKEDRLYVCNCSGNSLSRFDRNGKAEIFAKSELFACPNGVVFGPEGDLFVTNFNHLDLLRVSPGGQVSRFANIPGGAGNAHLTFSKGFFFVTKIIANQIVKVSSSGEVVPLAGTGQPGHEDGEALEATFFRPNGITISPAGDRLFVNTMIGAYSKPERSRLTLRAIDLMTLTKSLEEAMESGGIEEMVATYHRYKADPVRGKENTVAEMITFGYSFLSARRVREALQVFGLNTESYPDSPAAHYQEGEAYRYIGQTDQAISRYEKTLELDPEHAGARSRLEQLRTAP